MSRTRFRVQLQFEYSRSSSPVAVTYRVCVCVSQSLFNVSIVLRLIYSNCVIVDIYTPKRLFLQKLNLASTERVKTF